MPFRTPKLRIILSIVTIAVAALAVTVAAALVALTTYLHHTNELLASSVESVRLAQAAQIDLLLHSRASDALVRRDLESNLRRRLASAKVFVTTEEESEALRRAEEELARYVDASWSSPAEGPSLLDSSYRALDAVVE